MHEILPRESALVLIDLANDFLYPGGVIADVEHDRTLVGVAVGVSEGLGRVLRFDAGHGGTEVGEDAGAQRAAEIGEVEDAEP